MSKYLLHVCATVQSFHIDVSAYVCDSSKLWFPYYEITCMYFPLCIWSTYACCCMHSGILMYVLRPRDECRRSQCVVCMYVCVYVCMYVCVYVCMYILMHVSMSHLYDCIRSQEAHTVCQTHLQLTLSATSTSTSTHTHTHTPPTF